MRLRNRASGGVRLDCSWDEFVLVMGAVGSLATIMGRQADKLADDGKEDEAVRDNGIAVALGKLAVAMTAHVNAMKRRSHGKGTEPRQPERAAVEGAEAAQVGEPLPTPDPR